MAGEKRDDRHSAASSVLCTRIHISMLLEQTSSRVAQHDGFFALRTRIGMTHDASNLGKAAQHDPTMRLTEPAPKRPTSCQIDTAFAGLANLALLPPRAGAQILDNRAANVD